MLRPYYTRLSLTYYIASPLHCSGPTTLASPLHTISPHRCTAPALLPSPLVSKLCSAPSALGSSYFSSPRHRCIVPTTNSSNLPVSPRCCAFSLPCSSRSIYRLHAALLLLLRTRPYDLYRHAALFLVHCSSQLPRCCALLLLLGSTCPLSENYRSEVIEDNARRVV